MVIGRLADSVTRSVDNAASAVTETLFEPSLRLGVTGLARSGKTVFITSLVSNLQNRDRMPQLVAAAEGRIRTAFLQPQPDDTLPRFEFEAHHHALTSPEPYWPESTRTVSELRLSLRLSPTGLLGGLTGPRTLHLDIVDYPGEWLLDLSLLEKTYEQWSQDSLDRLQDRSSAEPFRAVLSETDPDAPLNEPKAQALAQAYTAYLKAARQDGYSDCTPGRFLLPGDLAGSPVLTFTPLPVGEKQRGTLRHEMARRYEAYKSKVVRPFFRDHFARLDRQIVLVDVLGAIHDGPKAVEDLRQTMADILLAFRPGANSWLSRLMGGKRVERILFAATKADHLHHLQHKQLTAIMDALVRDARARADYSGADTTAMSIAALRATVEETREHNGDSLPMVRGHLIDGGKQAAFYPGKLPEDPTRILAPAKDGADAWLGQDYQFMKFAPAPLSLRPGEGPPHIRLDRAAQFLIGDRL